MLVEFVEGHRLAVGVLVSLRFVLALAVRHQFREIGRRVLRVRQRRPRHGC